MSDDKKQLALATVAEKTLTSLQKETYEHFLSAAIPEDYQIELEKLAKKYWLQKN